VGCDLVVVGCCDLIVWVRFCWINGDLGEDLGCDLLLWVAIGVGWVAVPGSGGFAVVWVKN
jgi:hypothetical protein